MNYLELHFSPVSSEEKKSLLIAGLLDIGFESFTEEEEGVSAYISSHIYNDKILDGFDFLHQNPGVEVEVHHLEDKNWNKEWESNYQPVTIAGKCHVRAPFHPARAEMKYEIVIEPKMAFGTAHHETTRLVAEWLMDLEVKNKKVLDMGCGTGILAILANKMGAENVTGIDNDEWAWRNCIENFRINNVINGSVLLGDAALIKSGFFDLVLANINRNILIRDMKSYNDGLSENGAVLLSGFYEKDIEAISVEASKFGLHLAGSRVLNDWAVLLFYK